MMSHLEVINQVLSIFDCDMPADIHLDKDGYLSIQFNYGGLWFTLEHYGKWVLNAFLEYNDANTGNLSNSIITKTLGCGILDIVQYSNGNVVFVGDDDLYVFNVDE